MRIDKFTQKMQEALRAAQDVASQFNHQEITNEHFLSALLDQTDGITRPLLEKLGVPADRLRELLANELSGARKSTALRSIFVFRTNSAACSTARRRRCRS